MPISCNQYSYLIVNADDYGYFDFVSEGILIAANCGVVTATGVLANSKLLSEHVTWLNDAPKLDVGVHLNLTTGEPLSSEMQGALSRYDYKFPGKFDIVKSILSGVIKVAHVEVEWRAQIEKSISEGLNIRFLNSHEHIHMLPSLFELVVLLANDYKIDHVRLSTPELFTNLSGSALIRDSVMSVFSLLNKKYCTKPVAKFMGMGQSGKLDLTYLKKCIVGMKPGQVYELMCHPGNYSDEKVKNKSLSLYHNWKGELEALTHPSVLSLLSGNGVKLISYSDLSLEGSFFGVHREEDNP